MCLSKCVCVCVHLLVGPFRTHVHSNLACQESALDSYLISYLESPEPELSSKILNCSNLRRNLVGSPALDFTRLVQVRDPDCFEGGASDIKSWCHIWYMFVRWPPSCLGLRASCSYLQLVLPLSTALIRFFLTPGERRYTHGIAEAPRDAGNAVEVTGLPWLPLNIILSGCSLCCSFLFHFHSEFLFLWHWLF